MQVLALALATRSGLTKLLATLKLTDGRGTRDHHSSLQSVHVPGLLGTIVDYQHTTFTII